MEQTVTHLATGIMGLASFWWRWEHPEKERNLERSFYFLAAGALAVWNLGATFYRLVT